MKLAFDFDNVLSDFINTFIIMAEADYGIEIDYRKVRSYDLENNNTGLTCEQSQKLIHDICSSDCMTFLQNPVENAIDVLKTVYLYKNKHNPIVIISSRRHRKPVERWLNTYLENFRYTLFLRDGDGGIDKASILLSLGYDGIVDDNPEVCRKVKEAGLTPIVFDHPWNQELGEEYKRVKNMREVLDIV